MKLTPILNIIQDKYSEEKPVFTGKISKPVVNTISEASLKTYSLAIAAMGMAGVAISQKEDEIPTKITFEDFVEILKPKKFQWNILCDIASSCADEDGNVSIETVEKTFQILDLTDESHWRDVATNINACIEKDSEISQMALDNYIEFLKMGVPSEVIGSVIFTAGKLPFCSLVNKDCTPSAGSRIAGASAICVQFYLLHSAFSSSLGTRSIETRELPSSMRIMIPPCTSRL